MVVLWWLFFLKHFYRKKIGLGLENFYLVNFHVLVDFGVVFVLMWYL